MLPVTLYHAGRYRSVARGVPRVVVPGSTRTGMITRTRIDQAEPGLARACVNVDQSNGNISNCTNSVKCLKLVSNWSQIGLMIDPSWLSLVDPSWPSLVDPSWPSLVDPSSLALELRLIGFEVSFH